MTNKKKKRLGGNNQTPGIARFEPRPFAPLSRTLVTWKTLSRSLILFFSVKSLYQASASSALFLQFSLKVFTRLTIAWRRCRTARRHLVSSRGKVVPEKNGFFQDLLFVCRSSSRHQGLVAHLLKLKTVLKEQVPKLFSKNCFFAIEMRCTSARAELCWRQRKSGLKKFYHISSKVTF